MKYLCLVYGEENAIQSMNDRHCLDYDEAIRASGYCISPEALNEAIRVAAKIPPASVGSIEVRPIRPIRGD